MKKLITILFVIIATASYSQTCKYEINEIDKFTKKHTKVTKQIMLQSMYSKDLKFQARREGENVFLLFEYWECPRSRIEMQKITPGQKLMFLMENGSILELATTDSIMGSSKILPGIVPFFCSILRDISYPINADQVEMLFNTPITTIRFYRTEGSGKVDYIDFEITKRNREDLIELMKCV